MPDITISPSELIKNLLDTDRLGSREIISLVSDLDIENSLKFALSNFKKFSISRSITSDVISQDLNQAESSKYFIWAIIYIHIINKSIKETQHRCHGAATRTSFFLDFALIYSKFVVSDGCWKFLLSKLIRI